MPPTEEKIMSEIRICKYCSSEFTPKKEYASLLLSKMHKKAESRKA